MLFILSLIIFLALFAFIYGILAIVTSKKAAVKQRMNQIKDLNSIKIEDDIKSKSFSERMVKPFFKLFGEFLLKTTPRNKTAALAKKLDKAGLLKNGSMEKWLFTKYMTALGVSVFIGISTFIIEPNIIKTLAISLIIFLAINVFFNFYLAKRAEGRKQKILKDLPYTLDLITVSVEAGLSFDGAMARVVSNISGELCDEFTKSLKEIRMGIERKIALRNMSARCEVRELSMFITSLIQADELGVSLGKVLRIEAANLREHSKQAAREKAMKAPIKMLFPLIFFIFPSIFIIILGPAIIKIMKVFM